MYTYQANAIHDLAKQLKRGPIRLRLKQLLNIEFLLSVITADKSYPYDFVCHALTGYRPRSNGSETDAPLIDGEALRGDLATLAEDISEAAAIPVENWPESLYSVTDLAKRFDVSTKTIFRWRHRGLVGWKFRFADRRMRLAFPERCVRRFVAEHTDLVHRGSNFSQLTTEERLQIIEQARGRVEQGGPRTVNAVAKELAAETGRAVETIRLILKHYDEAHPKAGIFNRSTLRVGADDQRLAVWEAYVDGASLETLAARFQQPAAAIYRTLTQMRARALGARKIEYITCAEFEAPDADALILKAPAATAPYAPATTSPRVPADLPPYLQQLFRSPLLTPAGETALFRKLNYLRFKADRARQGVDPETVSASALDAIEALLDEAARVKNQITQANLRLVVSIAKRHSGARGDFFEIVSDGNLSLMRAVDKFDYTRGYKFSTYASWAIIRNYARTVPEQKTHQDRYQTGREELLDTVSGPQFDDAYENDSLPVLRGALERMLDTLDEREQNILRHRYGLSDQTEPQTLEQIGRRFGVSKERIRQIESRAITKLRTDFEVEMRQMLGTNS